MLRRLLPNSNLLGGLPARLAPVEQWGLDDGIIITLDEAERIEQDGRVIEVVPLALVVDTIMRVSFERRLEFSTTCSNVVTSLSFR